MPEFQTVGIIGLGYIGLPTALAFASQGLKVHGVDVDQRKLRAITEGRAPIVEPGLDPLLKRCLAEDRLTVSETPLPCDAFVIAVPTPFKDGHVPDLSYVEAAAATIAPALRPATLVILESTSPVGTTRGLVRQLAALRRDLTFPSEASDAAHDVHVAYCPERVLPGSILRELAENPRIVGGIRPCCTDAAQRLYQIICRGGCVPTNAATAEMVKLSENAFRDVNIAFANELSLIAGPLGVDVNEVIKLANLHPRVSILKPGVGVGGHCIAVDPWFLVHSAPEHSNLIRTARHVNDEKPKWVVQKILEACKATPSPRVACLGLGYKPDVDDVRESPSVVVIEHLLQAGINPIFVHDPLVHEFPRRAGKGGVEMVDLQSLLLNANIVALLTDHTVYRNVDPKMLADKIVIDPAGTWDRTRGRT